MDSFDRQVHKRQRTDINDKLDSVKIACNPSINSGHSAYCLSGDHSNLNVNNTFNISGAQRTDDRPAIQPNAVILNLKEGSILDRLIKISMAIGSIKSEPYIDAIRDGLELVIHDYRNLEASSDSKSAPREATHRDSDKELSTPETGKLIESILNERLRNEFGKISQKIQQLDRKVSSKLNLVDQNKANPYTRETEPWRDKQPSRKQYNRFTTKVDFLVVVRKANHLLIDKAKSCLNRDPDFTNGKYRVDYINLHPNGNAYIHCHDNQTKEKVFSILKQTGFTISLIEKKFDFFKIGPLNARTTVNEVITAIKKQNSELENSNISLHSQIGINISTKYMVFKSDHVSCQKLIDKRTANVSLTRVDMLPFIPLIQCHNCSRFGHMDKHCRFKTKGCPNCSGDHNLRECDSKDNAECTNCKRYGLEHNHHSWEKICPIRSKYMKEHIFNKLQTSLNLRRL